MDIRIYPDPVLARRCEPLGEGEPDDDLRRTIREMFPFMYKMKGVGLAANQVGISRRFFILNVTGKPPDEMVCINPEILSSAGTAKEEEGCLSLPGIIGKVVRAQKVTLAYTDLSGERRSVELTGFGARAAQHELDHLDGRLFIARLSPASRAALKAKLNEMERKYAKEKSK